MGVWAWVTRTLAQLAATLSTGRSASRQSNTRQSQHPKTHLPDSRQPAKGDPQRSVAFDHPNLIVYAASTEHMLALKARAARAQDLDDLRLLANELDLHSAAQVAAVAHRFFPDDPLSERAVAVLEDLFG